MIIDPILSQHLDPNDKMDIALLDLIQKGYLEYALNEETGELMFSLTDLGREVCVETFGEFKTG